MSNKLYNESDISDIADAIREKNGSSDTYKVSEMSAAIRAIPTGSGGLTVKKISWVGVEGWFKDIEIPIEDINCSVLRIVARNPNNNSLSLGAEAFDWGTQNIRYSNNTNWVNVATVTYTSPNVMHVVGAGQSTAQCFNSLGIQYDLYYTTWE